MDWGDWLNCSYKSPLRNRKPSKSSFKSYEDARIFVHTLKLESSTQWEKYCKDQLPELGKRPADIPASPKGRYAGKGWKGWGDFLGNGNIAPRDKKKVYLPFEQAREFARSLGLKSSVEWYKYR
jgi:hypothetical protein